MNRVDVIKDVCVQLGLTQIQNSWVKTLGAHLVIPELPGTDDYEQRVFVALFPSGTTTGGSVEIYDTFTDFPTTGEDNVLYVTKDANVIYRYDSGLNTYVLTNDPDIVNPDAPEEGQTFYVRLATSSRLNACTYNNGTAGVGATLTGNVNGQLGEINFTQPRIDTIAAAQGDIILVKNQVSALQNGIYEVTQLGDAGNPFILTRISGYDQTAEVYPSIVFVSAGNNNINRYFTQSTANPTIGTSNLVYGVATTTQQALPLLFLSSVTNIALPPCTYAIGTTYPSLPGWGATLTADVNGALGTINGVTMTSGMRLIIKDQVNQAHNGTYTVTNAGSATQRWVLTRWLSDSSQWHLSREFTVTNPSCNQYGSRWSVSSPLSMSNLNYGITPIIFTQKNTTGLIDGNGNVDITTVSGNAALTLFEAAGDANISVDNNIDLAASNNITLNAIGGSNNIISDQSTYISNTTDDVYIDVNSGNRAIDMYTVNGLGEDALISLNPSLGYNMFKTNGSSIFLSIDNLSFTNSNLLLQNNSAALRCYSANADVQVTAGVSAMGMYLDRNTTIAGMYNNEGNLDFYSSQGIVLVGDNDNISINANSADINMYANGNINLTADNGQINVIGAIEGVNSLELSNSINNQGIIMTDFGINIEAATYPINIIAANNNIDITGAGTGSTITISTNNNYISISETTDIIDLAAGNNISLSVGNAIQMTFGLIALNGLQTYADNTAAASGGIPANYLYKTPTGQVMIRY